MTEDPQTCDADVYEAFVDFVCSQSPNKKIDHGHIEGPMTGLQVPTWDKDAVGRFAGVHRLADGTALTPEEMACALEHHIDENVFRSMLTAELTTYGELAALLRPVA